MHLDVYKDFIYATGYTMMLVILKLKTQFLSQSHSSDVIAQDYS